MDDTLKAMSLAAGTDAGGIAIAPDGVVWVTDKRDAPTGTAGQVFFILPDGSSSSAALAIVPATINGALHL